MGVWSLLKISLHIQNYVNFVKEDSKMNILFHYPGKNSQLYSHCVVPQNIHTPPPNGRSLEIPRGRGGSKAVISDGWGQGVHGKLLFPDRDEPRKTLKAR